MQNLRVDIIKELDDEFLNKWQNLWEKAWNAHIYNSPRWFFVMRNAFGIKDYQIFVCYRGRTLLAILPLVYSKQFGIKVLTTPGCKYSDKSSFLIYQKDTQLLKFIILKIFNENNIYLPEVDEWILNLFKKRQGKIFVDGPSVNPFIPKEPDFLAFVNKRQKRRIKSENVRNQGNIEFRTYTKEQNIVSEIVYVVEQGSTRRSAGKGTFTDPNSKRLFNSIIKFLPDEVSLDVMFFKNKPISYMFGILNKKTFYAINTAYLEEYQDLIPGKMVVYYLLQRLQATEVNLFDFLRGTGRFKEDFTPFFSQQYDIYYSRNIMVRAWWAAVINFVNFIKETSILYKIYLVIKKQALIFFEPIPKFAHA